MYSQVPTTGHGDEVISTRIFGLGLTAVFVAMLLLKSLKNMTACYSARLA